jgi:YD repeat-containing protein
MAEIQNLCNTKDIDYVYYTAATGNNRLRGIDTRSVLSLTYAYDMIGNVTSITETTNSGQMQSFAYDALNRLVDAATSGGGVGTYDIEYGYNAVGNIITRTEGATTRVYGYNDADHVHAVTDIGSWSFIYDANGNMTSRIDGTGSYSQTFDVENVRPGWA